MLGSKPGQGASGRAVHELQKLWNIIFGLQGDSFSGKELKSVGHRNFSILYYFERSSGKPIPGVKVYLPVRHYVGSDLETAQRLQEYLETLGKADLAAKYIEALKKYSVSSRAAEIDYLLMVLDRSQTSGVDVAYRRTWLALWLVTV